MNWYTLVLIGLFSHKTGSRQRRGGCSYHGYHQVETHTCFCLDFCIQTCLRHGQHRQAGRKLMDGAAGPRSSSTSALCGSSWAPGPAKHQGQAALLPSAPHPAAARAGDSPQHTPRSPELPWWLGRAYVGYLILIILSDSLGDNIQFYLNYWGAWNTCKDFQVLYVLHWGPNTGGGAFWFNKFLAVVLTFA